MKRELYERFVRALEADDFDEVSAALQEGANPNVRNKEVVKKNRLMAAIIAKAM